jgi:hypothetical protein
MDTKAFQTAIRTATATYPIPFLIGILLLFALLCLGTSLVAEGSHRWALTAIGIVVVAATLGFLAYTIRVKPDLLRSEAHVLMMAITTFIGDSDLSADHRERISHALLDLVGQRQPARESDDGPEARHRMRED